MLLQASRTNCVAAIAATAEALAPAAAAVVAAAAAAVVAAAGTAVAAAVAGAAAGTAVAVVDLLLLLPVLQVCPWLGKDSRWPYSQVTTSRSRSSEGNLVDQLHLETNGDAAAPTAALTAVALAAVDLLLLVHVL